MSDTKETEQPRKSRVRLSPEERKGIRKSLFGHGSRSAHTFRFWMLLLLSVVIAVMGLTLGSTAVVIGAMLIAPLMEPILATSYSIATGSFRLTVRTASKVAGASIAGFLLSVLLSRFIPGDTLTPEVLSRTAPDLRDLVVAIAAGVAGAYATAKQDGASALPGVAVAVALVPPLAAIGVTFEAGAWSLAEGAALLYVTNLLAITAAGVGVFLILGVSPRATDTRRKRWSRIGSFAALLVVSLVAVILYRQTVIIAARNNNQVAATQVVQRWLDSGGSTLEIDEVRIKDQLVNVDLIGADRYPAIDELAARLNESFGDVEVRVRLAQRSEASSSDAPTPNEAATARIEELAEIWIQDSPRNSIQGVSVEDDAAIVEVEGPDTPPAVEVLATNVEDAGYDVAIDVRWTQQRALNDAELNLQAQRDQIRELAATWAHDIDPELDVTSVLLEESVATIDIAGPFVTGDPMVLEREIADVLDEEITVDVRLTIRVEVATTTTTTTTTAPPPTFPPGSN